MRMSWTLQTSKPLDCQCLLISLLDKNKMINPASELKGDMPCDRVRFYL